MPSFKHKTNKKIILDEKSIVTLDSKHKELEKEFMKEKEETLPELRAKKKYFNNLLKTDTSLTIDHKIEIKDMLYDITQKINGLKKYKKDYYLNNSKYIFDYFENKKDVSLNNNKTKLLNNFFKINSANDDTQTTIINKDSVQKYLSNMDESFINLNKFIV